MHLCVSTMDHSCQMMQRSTQMQSGKGGTRKCIKLRALNHTHSTSAVKDHNLHDASVVNLVLGPDRSNPRSMKVEGVQQPLLGLNDMEYMRRRANLHLGLGL